jgi:hypothetical protein
MEEIYEEIDVSEEENTVSEEEKEVKTCKECKDEKDLDEFRSKTVGDNTWYENICRKCTAKKLRESRQKLKEDNPEEYKKIVDKRKLADKKSYVKRKTKINERNNNYYAKNKEKIRAQRKVYKKENPDKVKKWRNNYAKSPEGKLAISLRRRVRMEVGSGKTWLTLLNCSVDNIKKWFEFNFELDSHNEMKWENYGKVWEIDHVKPCKSFDLNKKEDREKCFSWQNTLPVLGSYNKSKNDKIKIMDFIKLEIRLKLFQKTIANKSITKQSIDTATSTK